MPSPRLARWLATISQLDPARIELGLERTQAVFSRLSLPSITPTYVVAGTNGKGSVVRLIDRALGLQGYRVGRYTSPHLVHFRERIAVDDEPLQDDAIADAFDAVEQAREDTPLTYFEFTTLAALWAFSAERCTARVLEVGLGGRLDAVNVVDPDVAVVTNIGLDHQQWLGDTREQIGFEKAGVFRPARPAVIGDRRPPISLPAHADKIGSVVRMRGVHFDLECKDTKIIWHGTDRRVAAIPGYTPEHLLDNVATALAALEVADRLDIDETSVAAWIEESQAPARQEQCEALGRTWLLDVAHNTESVEALAARLSSHLPVTIIIGVMRDKPVADMLRVLAPYASRWIAVGAHAPRAMTSAELAARISSVTGKPALVAGSPVAGLRAAIRVTQPDEQIVVVGSFPVVGAVRAAL